MQLSVQKAQRSDLKKTMVKNCGMKNISNQYYVNWPMGRKFYSYRDFKRVLKNSN